MKQWPLRRHCNRQNAGGGPPDGWAQLSISSIAQPAPSLPKMSFRHLDILFLRSWLTRVLRVHWLIKGKLTVSFSKLPQVIWK
jgi:hypothetical protein